VVALLLPQASTRLSKVALKKLDPAHNILRQQTHTDVKVLHRLFSRPELVSSC